MYLTGKGRVRWSCPFHLMIEMNQIRLPLHLSRGARNFSSFLN